MDAGGTLVAQRLDVQQAALTGDPVRWARGSAVDDFLRSGVSVARRALVVYRTGPDDPRQLIWADRSGSALGTVGNPDYNNLSDPRVSPDGQRVAVTRTVQGNTDIWLLDGARMSRLTFDAAFDQAHVWSPDGASDRVCNEPDRAASTCTRRHERRGSGGAGRGVRRKQGRQSWSADGRFLLYPSADPQTSGDLWVVPMTGDRTPRCS